MADPIWQKILGTINSYFRLSLTGPRLKDNSGTLDVRNSDDSAYANVSCASPTSDSHAVTKAYADRLEKPMIVTAQVDGDTEPTPTSRRHIVVNSDGTEADIGDVWWDDGSAVTKLTATEGRTIAVTDALTGGTATFDTDSIYVWDADGSTWVKIGDIGALTGPVRVIRFALDNSASQDSTSEIPANARILECAVEVTTPYSAGATIQVGSTSTADLAQATTDNNPQSAARYVVAQDTAWETSASVVRVAVSNTPAAGVGVCVVKYTNPNA